MAETYNDIKLPFPTEGVIRSAEISDMVKPEESVELAINLNFDSMGAIQSRPGLTQYATDLAGAVISFGTFAQNASTNRRLLAQVGGTISAWNGTTWTSVRTGLSSTNKARYSQFLNLVYTVNGNTGAGGAAIQTYDGTTYAATNVGSLPAGDHVQAGYEGRVWVADSSTDRLYYTDIVSPTGVITGGTDYIEKLSPQNGESITALHRHPRALLVFKQNSIFRVYSASSVDPYPAYQVGTYSSESIVDTKVGTFFHHSSGFYRFTFDGQPEEISRRISDIVNAIPRANYDDVFGWVDGDGNNVYWNIGDITLNGVTYNNVVVRYTLSTEVWTVYSYKLDFTAGILYDDGTALVPVVGSSTGKVPRTDVGEDDLGTPIFWELESNWLNITNTFSKFKSIGDMVYLHENGAGAEVRFKVDKDGANKYKSMGFLDSEFVTPMNPKEAKGFNRIKLCVSGSISGSRVRLYGPEIIQMTDQGYKRN